MRRILLLGLLCAPGACVENSIILETEGVGDTSEPPATSTSSSSVTLDTGAGPTNPVTTTPPPPDPPPEPEPLPDFGSMDTTDGPPPCDPPCGPGEVCLGGVCFDEPDDTTGEACGFEAPWLPCLAPDGTPVDEACEPGAICLADGAPASVGICAYTGCFDECDCPLPPATANTPDVRCEDLTGTGQNECVLDCSEGQICPEGMECFVGFVCIFPAP